MIGYKQRIKEFITEEHIGAEVEIYGWVRTFRNNQFLSVNDGSTIQNLQVVVNEGVVTDEVKKKLSTGAAVRAKGKLLESQGCASFLDVQTLKRVIIVAHVILIS